jgi:hypothetical protein
MMDDTSGFDALSGGDSGFDSGSQGISAEVQTGAPATPQLPDPNAPTMGSLGVLSGAPQDPNYQAPDGSAANPFSVATGGVQTNSAPAPVAAPSQPISWRDVLRGAMSGMLVGAAGASQTNGRGGFAQGLGAGAGAEIQQQRQDTAQAQAIKFQNAEMADRAAQASRADQQMHNENENMQMKRDDHAMQIVKFNQDTFGTEYDAIPNTAENARNYLEHSTANNPGGAVIPTGVVMSPSTIYVPKQGPNASQQNTVAYNKMAPVLGLAQIPDGQLVNPASYQAAQNQFNGHDAKGGLVSKGDLVQTISNYQTNLTAYKAGSNPDPAVVAQAQKNIDVLKAQKDAVDTSEINNKVATITATGPAEANAAGLKAGAEARAKQNVDNSAGGNLTGDAFIATLPTGRQAQIRAIGEGRQELTASMLRTKDGQALSQQVQQAYPQFDQSRSSAYVSARKDFTSGATSKGINSVNTVLTHLGRMYQTAGQPNTSGGVTGKVTAFFGDKDVQALKVDSQAAATELAKAYAQGQISENEVKEWTGRLDPTAVGMTTGKLQTNIREIAGLLDGKQKAYESQWANAAPPGAVTPVQIVNQSAQQAKNVINGVNDQQQQATPNTHVFDSQAWAKANPGKDVNAAISLAKQKGFQVR